MPKMLYWTGRESTNWFSASVYFFLLSVTSFFPLKRCILLRLPPKKQPKWQFYLGWSWGREINSVSEPVAEITLIFIILTQLCPTLCDHMDCSPPGSCVHGILQARILEWVAISYSRGSSGPSDWTRVSLIVTKFFTMWATREACNTIKSTCLKCTSQCFGNI